MTDNNKMTCSTHGTAVTTFMCHHLVDGDALGFHMGYDPEKPDEHYPDAWCDRCNDVLAQEGGWTEKAETFADIKLVCSGCYGQIRERNWRQDDNELVELIGQSFGYLQEIQADFREGYDLDKHDRWDWYQETGNLIFSNEGKPVVECDIDFVGSLSSSSNTWLWAWANESFDEHVKAASRRIRELGDKHHFLKLACALWDADEVDGWEMTAVMAKETGAIGAYRTPSDNGFVYMLIKNARWVGE